LRLACETGVVTSDTADLISLMPFAEQLGMTLE